jgi:chemotaxis protein MotB
MEPIREVGGVATQEVETVLRSKSLPFLYILMTLAQSCVSISEHEALQRRLQASEVRLMQTQNELQRLQSERQRLRGHLDSQLTQLDKLQVEIGSLEAKRKAARQNLEEAQRVNQQLAVALDEKEKALASSARSNEDQEQLLAAYLDKLKSLIDSGDLSVSLVDGKLIVALPTDILFASGSAKISERGEATLLELGRVFDSMPDKGLQVEGHTDNVPIRGGKFESNWHLGHARAMAVVDILMRTGVPAQKLSAASYGEHHPKAPNTDEINRQKNRRIEIVVLPNLDVLSDLKPAIRQEGDERTKYSH